ncbi:ester cyclase [Maribacter polysaccharolyticus]|uniref:ester cyclase n=1 Tax=Maribacter polysaccharolyticus TaxID=3020831 RepID=UPI00237F0E41|nr:ester cyclase [Maribacter polysaccharolyticus]MDE3740792.1 ester cyclase [Maribacter polysaccharolyticus]
MGRKGIVWIIIVFLSLNCKKNLKSDGSNDLEQTLAKNFNTYITHAWNQKNMDSLRTISVQNCSRQLNGIKIAENLNELEANLNIYFIGFPDLKISIDHSAIKNNQLFALWTFEGTNTGTFAESDATGKHITVSGYTEITFDQMGKIAIERTFYNELALLQQLGYALVPPVVE